MSQAGGCLYGQRPGHPMPLPATALLSTKTFQRHTQRQSQGRNTRESRPPQAVQEWPAAGVQRARCSHRPATHGATASSSGSTPGHANSAEGISRGEAVVTRGGIAKVASHNMAKGRAPQIGEHPLRARRIRNSGIEGRKTGHRGHREGGFGNQIIIDIVTVGVVL